MSNFPFPPMLCLTLFLSLGLAASCQPKVAAISNSAAIDTLKLRAAITRMYTLDQGVQKAHLPNESAARRDSLFAAQDSLFRAHATQLETILDTLGFPDLDQVGAAASHEFFVLIQHCDHAPALQHKALAAMAEKRKRGLVAADDFAYLTDRIAVNAGEKQTYGTQLDYTEDLWIRPRPTLDSCRLDARRKEVGLAPIRDYLNQAMQSHYAMNVVHYEKLGLTGPNQYSSACTKDPQ